MLRVAILAGSAGLFALAGTGEAHAQYGYGYNTMPVQNVQCQRQKSSDGTAGAVVGALAGALIGGAIGNNIDNDRYVTQYRRRGPPVTYRERRSNSGPVAVGATLGAVLGGVAGSEIGRNSGPDCQVAYAPSNYVAVPSGSIPQSTRGLYGGAEVMRGAPVATAPYPHSPVGYPTSSFPSQPAQPVYAPQTGHQGGYQGGYQGPASGPDGCRVIHRETRMPDGQVFRDPVTVCQDPQTGQWVLDVGAGEELYGY
ncbi:glycine zipper domain-containing protein [Hyphomonas sp.]|uniref:glycine zipper domain-containing protein n=1 Tax=Hyphomonas sp. TaxID=87 RepID=UPI00391A03F9